MEPPILDALDDETRRHLRDAAHRRRFRRGEVVFHAGDAANSMHLLVSGHVKGSMTLQQVVDAFPPTTGAQVLANFSAPLDTPTSTQLKSLVESGEGMDIPALRTWLQERATR